MKKRVLSIIVALALPCIIFALPVSHMLPVASKTIVKVRNSATSDGVLTFKFKPQGGIAKRIEIQIRKGWSSLRAAREIAMKLRTAMPTQYRATSRSHGYIDCVDVEKDMTRYADFTLTHLGSTVDGLSIELEEDVD